MAALQRLESLQQVVEVDYTLPEIQAIETREIPESFIPIIVENYEALLENAKLRAEQEIEDNKTASYKSTWAQNNYKDLQKLKIEQISQQLFSTINGKKRTQIHGHHYNILTHQNKLQNLPEYGLEHALRLSYHGRNWINWNELFNSLLKPHHYEILSCVSLNS